MTRSELTTRILQGLNDSTTSPVFWSANQVEDYIKEGQEILAEEVQAIKRTAIFALRDGAFLHDTQAIATDIMTPYRLFLYPDDRKLEAVTMGQLGAFHRQWPQVTNTTPSVWFPVSWRTFGLWPAVTTGGKTVRMDYLAWPRTLLDDDDEPEIAEASQEALVLFGVYQGLLKRWNLTMALQVFAEFVEQYTDAEARTNVRKAQSRLFQHQRMPGTALATQVGTSISL